MSYFIHTIGSIIAFIVAISVPYKVLIAQKDASIELLKQEIEALTPKLSDAKSQSPDVLVTALSSRVEIAKSEIQRLKQGGDAHQMEIREKEKRLHLLEEQLTVLNDLTEDSELISPKCKAPLTTRASHTIYGYVNGREIDVNISNMNAVFQRMVAK